MSRARRARPTSGNRVGGGRLRVDAARAVDKLRDYQLADPAMWVLEALRAARASGAEEIHLDGDADDVWVGWSGPPLPHDALPRLLDELVSPQASDDRRALRLLATAINTALGLGPRWIDVYSVGADGATRVRYAPQLLQRATTDGAAEGLRSLATTEGSLPPGAPAIERGNVVHLRRFPALEALSLLATGQESRELRLARRACEDFPIPLRIVGSELAVRHSITDLLRVRLDPRVVGEGRDAFLAIVDPSVARAEATIDFAELGVVLATHTLAIPAPTRPGARIPIRVRVDAGRLPTNAARSSVRRDEPWIAALERHAAERVGELVVRLARELGPAPEGTWERGRLARLRAAALQLCAAWCGGPDWHARVRTEDIPEVLAPLFEAPLARDAVGHARSLRELARAGSLVVHTGANAVPEALAVWVEGIPWIPPGDPLALLWGGSAPASARKLVERAEASRESRRRWLERPTIAATVSPRSTHALTIPLVPPGHSARSCVPVHLLRVPGLSGEVALSGSSSRDAEIALVVEGRMGQTLRSSAPVPYDAIAQADGLRLDADHTQVEENDARTAVLRAIDAAVVIGCEAIARRLAGQDARRGETARWASPASLEPASSARLVRAGIGLALQLLERTNAEGGGAKALLSSKSPLLDAPAWPTVSGQHRSLAELVTAGAASRAVGYVLEPHDGMGPEPMGRPILRLEASERDLLALLLRDVELLDYAGLDGPPSASDLAREVARRCAVAIELGAPGHRGAFGWWQDEPAIELSHHGRRVPHAVRAPKAAHPYLLRVDDDRIVAPDGVTRFVPSTAPYDDVTELERRLALSIADAMLGRAPADLRSTSVWPMPSEPTLSAWLRACSGLTPSAAHVLGRERITALRSLRILPRMLTDERASIDELSKELGGEIVYVPRDAVPLELASSAGWHPLLATQEVAEGLGRLVQLRVRSGVDELLARAQAAHREARLVMHRRKPERALELGPSELSVRLAGKGFRGLLGIDRRGGSSTRIDVLLESRYLETRREALPHLVAVVDVEPELVDAEVTSITDSGLARVRGALRDGTAELVKQLAAGLRGPLAHDETMLQLVLDWVRDATSGKRRAAADRTIAALRSATMFATVQGGVASLEDASRKSSLVFAVAGDAWLGPAEGESPSSFDQPILALPESKDAPLRELVRTIADKPLRNVGADLRRLQAARRVRWGIGERPRVTGARDDRFRWSLEELMKVAAPKERGSFEALGHGELALSTEPRTTVQIFEVGARVADHPFDLRPGVVIACEPTFASGGWKSAGAREHKKLEGAVRTVLARAIRHVVETIAHDTLPGWVRVALRESALAGGRDHLDAIADVPIFETTEPRWITTRDLDAQVARFGELWVTTDLQRSDTPLDPERVAIRLPRAEMGRLSSILATRPAEEELRLDAIARRNRARPRVSSIGPTPDERARGIAIAPITGLAQGAEGIVLALDPRHVAARGMHVLRDRQPMGTLPDPSAWPALSWIDAPALVPDRTWSAPVEDAALGDLMLAVSSACEHALEAMFDAPDDALATLRIDRIACIQVLAGRAAQVRGLLWIELRDEPGAQVHDALGTSERVLTSAHRSAVLPLGGQLLVSGVAGSGATAVLTAIATHAYDQMTRTIARTLGSESETANELALPELVRAAALGHLASDHPGRAVPLPFLDDVDATLGRLVRALEAHEHALLVPPDRVEHARVMEWKGVILIDDGSLALRRAVVAFGSRVVSMDRALADRVLDLHEGPAAPEPTPRPAPSPAPAVRADAPRVEPQPAAAPVAPTPEPAHPLLARIDAFLRASGVAPGRTPEIRIDRLATRMVHRAVDGAVEIGARHPLVRALGAGDHPEALAIFTAHALGASSRSHDDATTAELAAILALLSSR